MGTAAEASSDAFEGPGGFAGNQVAVYHNVDEQSATDLIRVWSDEGEAVPCVELLLSALLEVATTDALVAAVLSSYTVSASPLPVAEAGDERVAWRGVLAVEGREVSENIFFDVVLVRVERAVSTFIIGGAGQPPDTLRDSLVGVAVKRLTDAST